jgi:hypothetical protein
MAMLVIEKILLFLMVTATAYLCVLALFMFTDLVFGYTIAFDKVAWIAARYTMQLTVGVTVGYVSSKRFRKQK